jgi:hypothetical protein
MGAAKQKRKAKSPPKKEGAGNKPPRTVPKKVRQPPAKKKPSEEPYDPLGFPVPAKKPKAEGEPSLGDDPLGGVYLPSHPKRKKPHNPPGGAEGKKEEGSAAGESAQAPKTMWRAPPIHFSRNALQWLRIKGVDIEKLSKEYNKAAEFYDSLNQNPPQDSLEGWHDLAFWAAYCGVISLGHYQELGSVRSAFAKAHPGETLSFDEYLSSVKAASITDGQNHKRARAQEDRIKGARAQTK